MFFIILKFQQTDNANLWKLLENWNKNASSADPDQTAPWEQSDQGLHCLPVHVCPNTSGCFIRNVYWLANGR